MKALIAASLLANAVLLWLLAHRGPPAAGGATTAAETARRAKATATTAAPSPLAGLAPAVLRDRLRALGVPDAAREALVRARIFARYDARRAELLGPALKAAPWWRVANPRFDPLSLLTPAERKELRDLEAAARDETLALLGPAALDRDGAIAFRYSFLPPDKAVLLDALERDYQNLDAQLKEDTRNLRTAADREQAKLIAAEHERDLAALLAPAEREAFALRLSPTASRVMERMVAFEPTEAEYRAVFAIHQALAEKLPAAMSRLEDRPEYQQQLRTALGEQRFAEWQFAGYRFVQTLAASAADLGISGTTVRDVGAIVYDTTVESVRLWNEPTLTPAQKIDAMAKLVADNRAQIAAKIGAEAAASYLKSLGWFDGIATGRAVRLNGTSGFGILVPPGTPPPTTPGPGRLEFVPSTPAPPRK